MRDSLVAFNIAHENVLLQNSAVPFLFYWNGENSIEDEMKKDDQFYELLQDKCFNATDYTKTKISCFYFVYDEETDEEKYQEYKINVQDIFLFRDMKEDHSLFYKVYLLYHMKKLYGNAFKKIYENDEDGDEVIRDIFNKIQELHPDRFSMESLCNYIRLQLQKHEQMNADNIEYVLDNLRNILTSIVL